MAPTSTETAIEFLLNGKAVSADAGSFQMTVLDFIRARGLTGAKEGCAEGECGACAVALVSADADGRSAYRIVNSCLVPVAQVSGSEITTIEGVAHQDQLHAVQQAFIDHGGAQCGICTPGMVLAAVDLLNRNPQPSETEIRNGLAGNLCRCTGYMKIFESVVRAYQK